MVHELGWQPADPMTAPPSICVPSENPGRGTAFLRSLPTQLANQGVTDLQLFGRTVQRPCESAEQGCDLNNIFVRAFILGSTRPLPPGIHFFLREQASAFEFDPPLCRLEAPLFNGARLIRVFPHWALLNPTATIKRPETLGSDTPRNSWQSRFSLSASTISSLPTAHREGVDC